MGYLTDVERVGKRKTTGIFALAPTASPLWSADANLIKICAQRLVLKLQGARSSGCEQPAGSAC